MDRVEIIKTIGQMYSSAIGSDKKAVEIIGKEKLTYKDASDYAVISGRHLSDAILEELAAEYPNGIGEDDSLSVVPASLKKGYRSVTEIAMRAQDTVNEEAGVGMRALAPDFDSDDAEQIARELSKHDTIEDSEKYLRKELETFSRKTVDHTAQRNAEAQNNAGMNVTVTRIYDGVGVNHRQEECQWCLERCGTDVPYSEAVSRGMFQRHPGCGCEIIYKSGKRIQRQSNWKFNEWTDIDENDKINTRAAYGLAEMSPMPQQRNIMEAFLSQAHSNDSDILVSAVIDNHEALRHFSPESMKQLLEDAGYEVLPLSQSKSGFNGKSLEENGGFKILFGEDGILRYHPEGGIHDIAYWTVSNGKRGKHRYDMDGEERFFK